MVSLNDITAPIMEFIMSNLKFLIQILIIPGLLFILGFVIVAVWFERKYLAHAMLRIGPLYAGKISGILQPIADFLKIFTKEIIVPSDADKRLFYLAPILFPVVQALTIILIPFAPDWVVFRGGGFSLILFFAISGLAPLFPLLAGWASNNKYAIISSLRTAYLCIAAEIPLLLSAVGVVILTSSFDLVYIVEAQARIWFIVPGFLGAVVFFIGILAESERVPFDIPVAEQEIVFGWRTEYSGILFMLTMMSEYIGLLSWSLLFITLYLGGYQGPILFGLPLISRMFWVLVKLAVLTAIIILFRTVFPRFRIDQAIKIGWKYLIPIAIVNVIIAMAIKSFLPSII